MAILWALQAPVTFSPKALGDLYGERATPPAAPKNKTRCCPAWSWPWSRRPCRLPKPEGRPRCRRPRKEIVAGLERQGSSWHGAYSAKCQRPPPPRDHRTPRRRPEIAPPCQWPRRSGGTSQPRVSNFWSAQPRKTANSPETACHASVPVAGMEEVARNPDQQILVTDGGLLNRLEREDGLRSRRRSFG